MPARRATPRSARRVTAGVVRDETGLLRLRLEQSIEDAQTLIDRSHALRSAGAIQLWLDAGVEWKARTARFLTEQFCPEVVVEFRRAVGRATDEPGARDVIHREQKALRDGIELLRALRSTQMALAVRAA